MADEPKPDLKAPRQAKPTSDPTVVSHTAVDDVRDAEDAWYKWKGGNADPVKVTSDVVYAYKEKPRNILGRDSFTSDESYQRYLQARENEPVEYDWVPDQEGQYYYDRMEQTKIRAKYAVDDAKAARAAGPAVRSYLDSELDKTSEINRQYKDFKDRASLLYALESEENQEIRDGNKYNMDMAADQAKYGGFGFSDVYVGKPTGSRLSDILRESLPDYVRPDYRLNGAVGLPGMEGFDDPDYDESGMPLYAMGTARQAIPPGTPPEIAEMLGKPSVPIRHEPWMPAEGIPYNGQSQRVRALIQRGMAR